MLRAASLLLALSCVSLACSRESVTVPNDGSGGALLTGANATSSVVSSSASSSVVVTASSSSSSGGGSSAGGGGAGGSPASTGVGGSCFDDGVGESNESEQTATALESEAIDECDGSGGQAVGTIAGGSDVDWYYYDGDDTLSFCSVDPGRSFTQSGSGLRLCKFAECSIEPTDVSCPGGTTAATSPEGRDGCCGTSGFEISLSCGNIIQTDDNARIYIRIDQPGGGAATCNDYTLSYHF